MKKNTSKQLLEIIQKFESILYSQPPYGDQYEGDIIEWIEAELSKYSSDNNSLIILKSNFIQIAQKFSSLQDTVTLNKINSDKVLLYFNKQTFGNRIKIKLKEGIADNQIIMLFRVLSKEMKIFDNTDEEIKTMLSEVFDFGYDSITSYLQRSKLSQKPKKLFKVDWSNLY